MSNTYIADSTDDTKSDDTLIIIVNADGTLSVDPETLQKLIANQHHKSAISVVRVGGDGSNTCNDGTCGESDEDKSDDKGEINSHVNLTVEGFYPPAHVMAPPAQSLPTSVVVQPTTTPAVETTAIVEPDSGGSDVLADPFSQMEPEELEKLETALQSEQAKQILGENVTAMLDMLSVDDNRSKPLLLSRQESVMMDHCYTSITGPAEPLSTTTVSTIASVTPLTFSVPKPPTASSRGRGRGKAGRGRHTTTNILQPKGLIPAGATLVPLVKQLVLPLSSLQTGTPSLNRLVANQGTMQGQIHRVVVQNNTIVAQDPAIKGNSVPLQQSAKVVVTKLPNISTATDVPILPSSTQSYLTSSSGQLIISSDFDADFLKKKTAEVSPVATKPRGRGRPPKLGNVATVGRGRGAANVNKKRPGAGRTLAKILPDQDKARKLEEEMAAALEEMDSTSLKDQFIPLESIESCEIPKKLTVNKLPPKKPIIVKIPKKLEETTKKVKDKSPLQFKLTPSKPKPNRKSADSSTTEGSPTIEVKSPVASSPGTSVESPITSSVTAATPASVHNKKYPKRENRKPPAHLAEALGPALFSTPDIIRRVSTDKPLAPVLASTSVTSPTVSTLPITPVLAIPSTSTSVSQSLYTSNVPSTVVIPSVTTTTPASTSLSSGQPTKSNQLEEDLLVDSAANGLLDSIHAQVSKQEEQLLAEALMLEDLTAMHAEEEVPKEGENVTVEVLPDPNDMLVTTSEMTEAQEDENIAATVDLAKSKHLSQTSLSSYFNKKVNDDTQSVVRTSILNQNNSDINRTKVIVETNEAVVDSTTTAIAFERINSEPPKQYVRKLPPIELPATRSASKRANQQKAPQIQEVQKKPVVIIASKKQATQAKERRKSADTKKVARLSVSISEEEDVLEDEVEETDDDNESYNSEDDPDRLWCICQKPHNNRFMICCDSCEEWFHGKCVGITKAMGQKMEQEGVEWTCPNCRKKRLQDTNDEKTITIQPKTVTVSASSVANKMVLNETKAIEAEPETVEEVIIKKVHMLDVKPKDNVETIIASTSNAVEEVVIQRPVSTLITTPNPTIVLPGSSSASCIVCKKEAATNSIYCGDECITKHATESLAVILNDKLQGQAGAQSVIVFERKTGRLLAGPNAPLTSNLTSWLLTHPTFEVMRPGILPTAKFYNQKSGSAAIPVKPSVQQKPAKNSVLRQTVLNPRLIAGAAGKQIQLIAALPQVIPPDSKASPITPKAVKGQQVAVQQSITKSSPATPKIVKAQQQQVTQPHPLKVQTIAITKVDGNPKAKTFVIKNVGNKSQQQLPKGQQQQITSMLKVQQQDTATGETTPPLAIVSKVSSVKTVPSSSNNVVMIMKKQSKEPVKTQTTPPTTVKKQNMVATPTISKKPVKEEVKPIVKKPELSRSDSQSISNPGDGPKGIRFNVCKALKEALSLRFKECPDVTMDEDKVENLAVSIEEELNALLKESAKYKNKFRSLVFNIKDPKNQTLFRKIADGSITPDQVVRLTSEEMASQELAQWREREARHQLDMIKKNELELLQQAKTIVMKTHKGEQVIENEDGISSKNPETSVTELESALSSNVIDESVIPSIKEKEFIYSKLEKHLSTEDKQKHNSKKKDDKKKRNRKHSKSSSRDKSHKKHRSRSRSRSRKSSEKEKEKKTTIFETGSKTKKANFEELKIEVEPIKELHVEEKDDVIVESAPQNQEEVESDLSDREPSSTVNIKTPPYIEEEMDSSCIWQGTLMMNDVAKFKTTVQEVSGGCNDLATDLPNTVDCVGRINPDTVWDYISKMKKSGTKEILVIRFTADNEEDKMSYLSLYSYLSSRNRMGVVGNASKMIKDFYVLPLASHSPVPQVLLPLDGPGFEDYRPHLLLGIIVRTRRKRVSTERDLPFIPKIPKKKPRSYTPPIPGEVGSHTPPNPPPVAESFTPPYSPRLGMELKTKKVKESSNSTVSDAYDIEDNEAPYSPIDEDTPYSPGDGEDEEEMAPASSPGDMECSAELQRKMDELNRRIEEQKKQIVSITSAIGVEPRDHLITESQEDEAYSPSRSFTPPAVTESIPFLNNQPLPDISLPSNLQEILASIKKQPAEPKCLDLKLDPIVQAYSKVEEPYSPGDKPEVETGDSSSDNVSTPVTSENIVSTFSSVSKDIVKVSRDPRQRSETSRNTITSLSQLSDEELIRKAAEMGFMNPENPKPIPEVKRRTASDQPPPPGLEDEYNFPPTVEISPPTVLPPSQVPSFSAPQYSAPPFNRFSPAGPPLPPPPPPPPLPPMHSFPHNYIPSPQGPPIYQQPMPHIPYTNPQPPPPELLYPPPQPPPPQLPPEPIPKPPPPKEHSITPPPVVKRETITRKSKKSEKLRSDSIRSVVEPCKPSFETRRLSLESKHSPEPSVSKVRVEKRKYSDSANKDYESERSNNFKKRERFMRKRDKRENWEYEKLPDKRREPWEYDPPPVAVVPSLPPIPPRGGMRGRFHHQRGRFQIRRGFDRPSRGFHRGFHPPRGHPPRGHPPGPSRGFHPKRIEPRGGIQTEWEEEIRQFEEKQRHRSNKLKQKIEKEKHNWRNSTSPIRKRRTKDSDVET